ncbi:MAG TPA: ferritin family protein, partial [Thermoanaerobaculales bacterium]|nr:ferritin family protein [Thermoanaerobaculales bacterium]
MTQAKEQIREILRKAYQIEVDGHTFYSMAAERADKPAVQELFAKLARDEVQHKAYLKTVMGSFEDKGVEAFHLHLKDPNLKAFTATIFTDRFREQANSSCTAGLTA